MRGGCAGEIGPVRLPPRPRRNVFLRRQGINGVVQPAMPGRRHDRSLGGAAINHPASLESEPRIDLAAPRAVIAVAERVIAHELAVERGPQQRAEGRPAGAPRLPVARERTHSLPRLKLPREAREVSEFNDLPKGLGESCPTGIQGVLGTAPKPSGTDDGSEAWPIVGGDAYLGLAG